MKTKNPNTVATTPRAFRLSAQEDRLVARLAEHLELKPARAVARALEIAAQALRIGNVKKAVKKVKGAR